MLYFVYVRSVVFPWAVSLPLYNGNGFNDLCNWAGVILAAYVNFIIPPYLFIWAYMENKSGMYMKPPANHSNSVDANDRAE